MAYTKIEQLQLIDIRLCKLARELPESAEEIYKRREYISAALHEADNPTQSDSAEFVDDVLEETREYIEGLFIESMAITERAPDSAPETLRSPTWSEVRIKA